MGSSCMHSDFQVDSEMFLSFSRSCSSLRASRRVFPQPYPEGCEALGSRASVLALEFTSLQISSESQSFIAPHAVGAIKLTWKPWGPFEGHLGAVGAIANRPPRSGGNFLQYGNKPKLGLQFSAYSSPFRFSATYHTVQAERETEPLVS